MITSNVLKGEKILLRIIELNDCSEEYLKWLNTAEVNQYLETRWEEQTLEKISAFVQAMRESSHSYLFAIIADNKHIGNIKIGPIHPIYKKADLSYFIGNQAYWGKGIATEAIKLMLDFSFNQLGLNKVYAGAFEENVASQKALERNGFKREAVFEQDSFLKSGDKYSDVYKYGILKNEYK